MKTAALWQAFLMSALMSVVGYAGCNGGGVVIQCGGGAEFQCPAGLYCELGKDCGGIDRLGTCRRMPPDCTPGGEPVCSCNKKDFPNACYANAAGYSVAYNGPCL